MDKLRRLLLTGLLLAASVSLGASRHTLGPSGAYHVRATTDSKLNAWSFANAQTYSRAIAGFYTSDGDTFDGTNARGRMAGGASVMDYNLEGGYPCDIPGEINSKTPAGTVLKDGYVYTVTETVNLKADYHQNALIVDESSTVVIYIPEGVSLAVKGGSHLNMYHRACAAIRLPPTSTLVVCGEGSLVAKGGAGSPLAFAPPAGIGGGGAADSTMWSGGAAGIGGNGCLPDDTDTTEADMGKLFVLGSVSVDAKPGWTEAGIAAGGDPGLFCTSQAVAPTLDVRREPDAHVDTHWAVRYDVTVRDDDGSELLTTKATLSMFYEPISPPVREDMLFLGCTNRVGKLVIGPLGGSPNVCTTPGAHEVYAVWILGINTTRDPPIEEISFDDEEVSLREIIYRISQGGRGLPLPCPIPVPISPVLTKAGDTSELVLNLRDEPLRPALPADTPIRIDGRLARERPLVLDGSLDGGSVRTTPIFSLTNDTGLILQNVTVRNASGAVDGLVVQATNTASLVISNVLFSALDPGSNNRCVRADGRTRVQQSSWYECTGMPIALGQCGEQALMLESTVVARDTGDTEPVAVGASGAVMACTIPSGVKIDAGGQVIGSITEPITEEMCDPVAALSTNVCKVMQYYYQVIPSNADLVGPGKGCFVWHDADWQNVAYSDQPFDPRTAVFGAADKTDAICLYDVRGLPIQYLWNTRGSYAVHWLSSPLVVNTTADPSLADINLADDVVSLREALLLIQTLPIVRSPDGTPNKITFSDELFKDHAEVTLRLTQGTLTVQERQQVSDPSPIWICGPGGGRSVTIDGGKQSILFFGEGVASRMSDMTFRNGKSSGDNSDGAAITSKGCLQALERCTFEDNKGTAVWIDQDPLVVSECIFKNNGNNEWEPGGAIFQQNARRVGSRGTGVVTVIDSVFEGNAANFGGAICAYGELRISGSTFTENQQLNSATTRHGGGAIYVDRVPLTISNSHFHKNQSQADGGAIVYDTDGVSEPCKFSVSKSEFVGNSCAWSGGAIGLEGSKGALELSGVVFATNTAVYDGGAVYMKHGALTVERCRFERNIARRGGGFALFHEKATEAVFIGESTFLGNAARGNAGGALFINRIDGGVSERQVTVVNSSFLDNSSATNGGAIYQNGCDMLLANVTLRGNSTEEGVGGAYCGWEGDGGRLALVNVIASGNQAGGDAATDDFKLGQTDGFIGYASAIKRIKDVQQESALHFWTGNVAAENAVYANRGRVELSNGTLQTAERLRSKYALVHAGARVEHDAAWTNVVCRLAGDASYHYLRGNAAATWDELRTDITCRTYLDEQQPCMGCLWDVDDPPSAYVTTLLDVVDSRDGLTSLREIIDNLATSEDWRTALYNPAFNAYDILFVPGLNGALHLECALEIPALNGAAVFIRVPGDMPIAIDGQNYSRAFAVRQGGILDLANLTIRNCCGLLYGTDTYDGGAIVNAGTLNVSNVAFYACTSGPTNTAPFGKGGAVCSLANSTTRLRGCTFAGCTAARGGALAVGEDCTFTVCNSTFVSNAVNNAASVALARGNALYLAGAETDLLVAQCTFADNVGSDHLEKDGAGAVYIDNAGTQAARVSIVNSVLVGNGQCDLATSGRVRLVGSVYGIREAIETCEDPWCEWYSKHVEQAITTADVYAHTTPDGRPLANTAYVGSVPHLVCPLLAGVTLPSVWLRASIGWLAAGWGETPEQIDDVFRGTRIGVKYSPLWNTDQKGATTVTNWLGAVIEREYKQPGEPEPSGDEPGVITEPTYENFVQALSSAQTSVAGDIVITLADDVRGQTIAFEREIELTEARHVTIIGPLTLDADGFNTRFFSLGPGVTLTLVDITLLNGRATTGSVDQNIGGAVFLDGASSGKQLAAFEAYDCTFADNAAETAGGVVYANGLACSETFVRCTFTGNAAAVGAAICHDDMNLTLTDTIINLNDIWPRPAVALEVAKGSFALFANTCDDQSEAALKSVTQLATAEAERRGVTANVRYLTFAAAQAAGGDAALAAMMPNAGEIVVLEATGEGKVITLTPKNVVPYLWYAIESAATPVGPYTVEDASWVQANPDGTLPKALTAPVTGESGFYRIVVRDK